jgi:hypothetical protein
MQRIEDYQKEKDDVECATETVVKELVESVSSMIVVSIIYNQAIITNVINN